jgi:hypothetical protein
MKSMRHMFMKHIFLSLILLSLLAESGTVQKLVCTANVLMS